jgi:hypothetical protein
LIDAIAKLESIQTFEDIDVDNYEIRKILHSSVISDTLFAVCLFFFSIVYLIDLFCALLLAILFFISDKKQSASFSIPVSEVEDLEEAKEKRCLFTPRMKCDDDSGPRSYQLNVVNGEPVHHNIYLCTHSLSLSLALSLSSLSLLVNYTFRRLRLIRDISLQAVLL